MNEVILCHPTMEGLAAKATEEMDVHSGIITWKKFRDGWPELKIISEVRNRDAVFIASFHSPEIIFEQLAVIYAIPRYFARSLRVVLPFFPVGTMERVDEDGEIATAMTMIRMLQATPMTQNGPAIFSIFDIHALPERFFFNDSVLPDLRTAIPLLLEKIARIENVAVAFPDDGAYKRFGRMFPYHQKIFCGKERRGEDRIITIKEGDPKGKYVVVIDDLIQTGGTMLKCREALVRAGARAVSLYATHGVFPGKSYEKFSGDLFERVWITDSCPQTVEAVAGLEPFEVLSLAPLISKLIVNE